ncbi:unnamed protein product [Arctia plantaginis]|uniref:Fatty acyl-CoA reductase n=1 Tax=Arctia plantaginis TaxID=874455 RepID=A0A8S0ZYJ5_ARCPL|nr:unnamed protein product [Arctia plantaginis]
MLKDPVYDMVRRTQSDFADILEAIEGDISELNLGLSDKDYAKITDEVDFVVHMAATIRFDGPLRDATLANVRGVRECVLLAKACKNLKCFTYVSTAFTHATRDRIGTELKEQFYPCPVPPDQISSWPKMNLKRPPVVVPAYYEPSPGWSDLSAIYGPTGFMIGVGLGVLHVFPVETDKTLNIVPVDYVNNAIIAATWDTCERRKHGALKEIPIYSVSSTKRGYVWDFMAAVMRSEDCKKLASPLAVWYCYGIEVTNPVLYWLLTWILHYIPAYMADIVCAILGIKIKEITSFRQLYQKFYKMSNVFCYFFNNEWTLKGPSYGQSVTF